MSLPYARARPEGGRSGSDRRSAIADATFWVTATGDDGAVRVTVTDRGQGFDSRARRGGFGINQSIRGRMRAAGGEGHVRSWVGEGTEVELEWPTPRV